jgi:flagellar basal body P-ring formation protein FlgA
MRRLLLLTALAAAIPAIASAGAPVSLRASPVAYEGVVTLGDLFDGAEGSARSVVVGRSPAGGQAVLDSGQVQTAAHAAGLDWDNTAGLRRVIVTMARGDARPTSGESHASRRGRTAQVLVYAHNMMAGDVISAGDLEWSDAAIAGSDAPHDPDMVIGKLARGPLRAGAAIAIHDLTSPKVVRRGDMISVDYVSDGVSLSLEAKAMNDAAAGDSVQAMNLSSKKMIDAVATRPGHAAVGPGADAARAGAPTLMTAALR